MPLVDKAFAGRAVMNERDLVIGRWEITEMDLWDKEVLDLVKVATLRFNEDGMGSLGFIAVRGWIDYRVVQRDGSPYVEFSWEGSDEGDRRSGRAWAQIDGDTMTGRFFIHASDDSGFVAKRLPGSEARHVEQFDAADPPSADR